MKAHCQIKYSLSFGKDEFDNTRLCVGGFDVEDTMPPIRELAGQTFHLSIPSGIFSGIIDGFEKEKLLGLGDIVNEVDTLTVTGVWTGRQMGLVCGLSGRGYWSISSVKKVSGTFGEFEGQYGELDSLEEYQRVSEEYRSRFSYDDQETRVRKLTTLGNEKAGEFLASIGNPKVNYYVEREEEDKTLEELTPLLSNEERLNRTGDAWRQFGNWLDLKYPDSEEGKNAHWKREMTNINYRASEFSLAFSTLL